METQRHSRRPDSHISHHSITMDRSLLAAAVWLDHPVDRVGQRQKHTGVDLTEAREHKGVERGGGGPDTAFPIGEREIVVDGGASQ